MTPSEVALVAARLTYNGAANLRQTIVAPNKDHPELINGGSRLSTGLGKWTHIAARGVENNLIATKVAEGRHIDFNDDGRGWEALCITPLGREVAYYIDTHWDALAATFRDFCGRN